MYSMLLQHTLIKLAYGCCTKLSTTYMLKSAQKINFTHLLKLYLKKHSIRYVDSGKNKL